MEVKKNEIFQDTENSKEFSREEKDDEISIDLSKIKNFFKRKKEDGEKKPEVASTIENKDTKAKPQEQPEPKSPSQILEEKPAKENDDEIEMDFSKIRNIFGKKESSTEEKEEIKADKEDDEISIDFSKLKNIKNIFKKSGEVNESDENISVDYKKISDFFVTHRVLLLLLIPLFLSIFLRVQPAYLPATDQWAANTVIGNIRSQISQQINQQYPNLPDQNKGILVDNELQKILEQEKSQIDQQITATSNFFKSKLQDDSGLTYLPTIDPYYWLRFSENIIKNGHPGDEIRDGQLWDNHMFAPEGRGMPSDMFHAYFTAYLFKFLSFFNRGISLTKVAFYIPVLISALAVIPTFFIARRITGNFGGFVAATIIAIHPSLLTRTIGGIFDTDGYNVMFPLLIAWIFLGALESKNIKHNAVLSVIGGLLVGLYAFTWGGWWYIFDFVLISTVLYMAYFSFAHRTELAQSFTNFLKQKAIKNSIIFFVIFFIVSALSVSLFMNFEYFNTFVNNPMGFVRLKEVGITTIWPNVFTTVAEQNPASLNSVVDQIGFGKELFFLIALMGITMTITKKEYRKLWFVLGVLVWYIIILSFNIQNLNTFLILVSIPIIIRIGIALWESDTEIEIKYAIFLIVWFIATTYASTKGVRFTMLLVPAFAIGFGIALGEIYRYASAWIAKGLHVNKYISKTTVMIILLLLLIAPYRSAAGTAKNMVSDFNDNWRISLEKIKSDSQPNAIVNSWWDYGHWFKFWTDRAVTFDGTSQNSPQAHWIGKVLLTDKEELAIGILRMLDCSGGTMDGGTSAFGAINSKINDGAETISILDGLIVKDKEEAREYLKKMFNDKEVEEILSYTHCQPPENYFITSEDMIGKSGVWAHFGSWNFDKALVYNTLKKKEYADDLGKGVEFLQKRFNYSEKEAENVYYEVQSITTSDQANSWIAPWPGYAGTVGCGKDKDILTCNNGFTINLTSKETFAQSQQGIVHPKAISFPTNDGIIVKEYNESLVKLQNGRNLGFALIKEGDNYNLLQMDSDLTASIFTRLFYQEGIGLRYFKKFSDERSIFGNRIIVWKVDWEGKEKAIIETPKPETEETAKIEKENITNNINDSQNMSNTQ